MLESMTTYVSVRAKSIHNEDSFIVVAREGFWTESHTKSAVQEIAVSHWPVAHWVDIRNSLSLLLWISWLSHFLPEYVLECPFRSAWFLATIEYFLVSEV